MSWSPSNRPLQSDGPLTLPRTDASVATLPLASAAERQYR